MQPFQITTHKTRSITQQTFTCLAKVFYFIIVVQPKQLNLLLKQFYKYLFQVYISQYTLNINN